MNAAARFIVRRRGDPFPVPPGLRVIEVCAPRPCDHPGCVEGHELRARSCAYCDRPIALHPATFLVPVRGGERFPPTLAHISCVSAALAHPAPDHHPGVPDGPEPDAAPYRAVSVVESPNVAGFHVGASCAACGAQMDLGQMVGGTSWHPQRDLRAPWAVICASCLGIIGRAIQTRNPSQLDRAAQAMTCVLLNAGEG